MLTQFYLYLMNLLKREEGQDLAEYAFLLLLIAVIVIAAVLLLGEEISTVFESITSALQQ